VYAFSTNPDLDIVDRPHTDEEGKAKSRSTAANVIFWVDAFTAVYFTIEYVVRLATTPRKFNFFIQPQNLIDLFAILPYFVNMIVDHLSEFHIIGKAGKVVRLVRVTKILRVFKLVRHFAGLQSLFFTIRQASRELGLLILLIGVSVLTFSSLIYFAEKDDSTNNWSFMDSFWWGLLTMTTVGNGNADRSPVRLRSFIRARADTLIIADRLAVPAPEKSQCGVIASSRFQARLGPRRRRASWWAPCAPSSASSPSSFPFPSSSTASPPSTEIACGETRYVSACIYMCSTYKTKGNLARKSYMFTVILPPHLRTVVSY
jgi:hypothetical protein